MKTIAYFDCPTGISGDMCLGALLDAGVPLDYLRQQLGHLGLDGEFTLTAQNTLKQGQRAIQAEVTLTGQPAPSRSPEVAAVHHHHPASPEPEHSHPHPSSALGDASLPPPTGGRPPARNLPAIEQLITQAPLPQRVKHSSLAIFRRLGEAEAAVHGIPVDQVHFHEVGATDAIVDIVGTCLGLDYLNVERLYCSPLPTGQGRVWTAHGWLPVPAPAVLKLMELGQVPLCSNGLTGELVTPTGAAIVTTLAHRFGEPPAFVLTTVGLGAGRKPLAMANILRLWVGQDTGPDRTQGADPQPLEHQHPVNLSHDLSQPPTVGSVLVKDSGRLSNTDSGSDHPSQDTVVVLETQVDDLIPQAVGHLYDQLFQAGALDVFTQPVAMKKSRPGLLITVLCPPPSQDDCETVLFTETTTLGIRHRRQPRTILQRRFETVETAYGPVSIKLAYHPKNQRLMNAHPEYEDCVTLARNHRLPWQEVYQAALAAWRAQTVTSFSG